MGGKGGCFARYVQHWQLREDAHGHPHMKPSEFFGRQNQVMRADFIHEYDDLIVVVVCAETANKASFLRPRIESADKSQDQTIAMNLRE